MVRPNAASTALMASISRSPLNGVFSRCSILWPMARAMLTVTLPLTAISFTIGLVIALQWMRRRWPKDDPWLQWGALLVTAGAVGNLYDRLTIGFVVDFLHLHHWPVFNVADMGVTIGGALIVLSALRADARPPSPVREEDA